MAAPQILNAATKTQKSQTVQTKLREVVPDGADWDRRKADSVQLALDLLDIPDLDQRTTRRYTRQLACSPTVTFGRVKDSDKWVAVKAQRCKSKLCATCSRLKATADFCRLLKAIQTNWDDDRRFLFLTLTVPNCPIEQLREILSAMTKAWSRDIARSKKYQSAFDGAYIKVEVTRGANGSAHPHFHILLATRERYFAKTENLYLSQKKWESIWTSAMKSDQRLRVDIRAVQKFDVASSIAEVAKYIAKASDLEADPAWTAELDQQLLGLRLNRPSGVIRRWLAELENERHEIDIEWLFGWFPQAWHYRSVSHPQIVQKSAEKHERWTRGFG